MWLNDVKNVQYLGICANNFSYWIWTKIIELEDYVLHGWNVNK